MTTLVFLEHHGGELQKGSVAVLSKAATLGGEVAGVIVGSGPRVSPSRRPSTAPPQSTSPTTRSSKHRSRSPASTRSRSSSGRRESRPCSSPSRSSPPTSPRARGPARGRAQLAAHRPRGGDGGLVGKQSALGDSVVVDVGWKSTPQIGLPRRRVRPVGAARAGTVDRSRSVQGTLSLRRWSSRRAERAVCRSRTRT